LRASKQLQTSNLKRLENACRERGIPVTVQRRVIFTELLERDDHPTVDQIFDAVKKRIPGVSRTTVYRTLETLADLGLARRTNHFEAFGRFDGNMEQHHHLVCTKCGKLTDFQASGLSIGDLPDVSRSGFALADYSIYFEGRCSDCQRSAVPGERRKPGSVNRAKSP
jgi:Fur family peroxide stress response transcriptional regulator